MKPPPFFSLLLFLTATFLSAREVAITIDDLPRGGDLHTTAQADRAMTIKLLAPFQHRQIPLIGFVNECHHTDELQSLLALWVAAGAELGNHTCSHLDLNTTTAADYESDIVKGEGVTSSILGHRPVYFRYPFLHAGQKSRNETNGPAVSCAKVIATLPSLLTTPITCSPLSTQKALTSGDADKAKHVREVYLAYMESIFEFFEGRSIEVTGHEVRQSC